MPITRSSIKTGPATVTFDSQKFHFKSGLTLTEEIETFDIPVDTYGRVDVRVKDRKVTIKGTPAGEWEALSTLFPWVGSAIGTRIHGDTDRPLVIHAIDGTRYTYHNATVTKMPSLKFSAVQTLLGEVEFTARTKDNTEPTAAASLVTRDTASWSDTTFASANILVQPYSLAWGSAPWDSFATIDGIEVELALKLSPVEADGYGVLDEMIAGLDVSAKFKPLGIAQSAIDAKLAMQNSANAARGSSLNARGEDLIISGTGVYVSLTGAAARSVAGEFGMEKIRSGEMQVVATRTFASGVANPLCYIGTEEP